MTDQKRASSIDIASINLQHSPAPPQYTHLPPKLYKSTSNNPYYNFNEIPIQSTGKSTQDDAEQPVKPDYDDPNYPHYVQPVAKAYDHGSPPPRPHRQWRRKRVLVPWILAFLFFLTTLWFTSIALGARVFMILQPLPSSPPVHEINVFIDGQEYHTSAIALKPTTASSTIPSTSATPKASSTSAPLPNTTGRLHLVQTGQPSLEDIDKKPGKRQVARFVTVTRRMQ
ncbi:hypothetical protein GQ44DRAFT_730231 [Phaeosphaeriaceae sp. PMI808]|nr:hypothetical protein GQ44DRAFT_730231 [Phaeosphaeriaceae sp. PMI808]